MRLRKCSLRKMMRDGHVDDQIKRQVLQLLKPIATNDFGYETNGDLKETVLFLFFYVGKIRLKQLLTTVKPVSLSDLPYW